VGESGEVVRVGAYPEQAKNAWQQWLDRQPSYPALSRLPASPSFQLQITPADSHDHNLRKGIAVEPYVLRFIFPSPSGTVFHII